MMIIQLLISRLLVQALNRKLLYKKKKTFLHTVLKSKAIHELPFLLHSHDVLQSDQPAVQHGVRVLHRRHVPCHVSLQHVRMLPPALFTLTSPSLIDPAATLATQHSLYEQVTAPRS